MSRREELSEYLKRIQSSLLVMGDDVGIVEQVARGIFEHPKKDIRSVRVWQLSQNQAELVHQVGESMYQLGRVIPSSYAPLKEARRNGYVLMTSRSEEYDPGIEGVSKQYLLLYWRPDKMVSIELKEGVVQDDFSSEKTLEMIAQTFNATLKKETVRSVMREARHVQDKLLPSRSLSIEGYDVSWMAKTARLAGGDFMLFHRLMNNSCILALGDCEGKGIEAAVTAGRAFSYLRGFFDANPLTQLGSAMEYLNTNFVPGMDKTVSLVLTRLRKDGRLSYVNAGHVFPVLVRADGAVRQLADSGLLLSVFQQNEYIPSYEKLKKGDVLFLYTDGLTDSLNDLGENYPEGRLEGVLAQSRMLSAEDIVGSVWSDSSAFRGERDILDDTLLCAIRYVG